MSVHTGRGPLPPSVASRYQHGYAVVDVETSGLSPAHHRVLQVAVTQVEPDGALGRSWSSLLDPGCDPGPVHVHGLTRERLAGAPQYQDVVGTLDELLRDRVLVAHNARFDWGFLAAESDRARSQLSVGRRLCTQTLSRRLDLPVSNLTLATVAAHWGVEQRRAHDAEDDVRVLVEILRHSLVAADRLGMALPIAACGPDAPGSGEGGPVRPSPAPRVPCAWAWPGRWDGASPWVQGMKIVFTGPTERSRDDLVRLAVGAGLDVMNSASSRTSVVVCASPAATTRKLAAARAHGIEIVDEGTFLDLVGRVAPGRPVRTGRQAPAPEVALHPLPAAPRPALPVSEPPVPELPSGGVIDLPDAAQWSLSVRRPEGAPGIDVVAFVTDDSEQVADDTGLVFFNAPEHPSGAVSVVTGAPGETRVALDLGLLPEGATRIVVASSTEGETTFGEIGPVELVLRSTDGTQVARSTLDAGTVEQSMVLATVYRRRAAWRFRAVGQGHETGLAGLVRLFGVAVDG